VGNVPAFKHRGTVAVWAGLSLVLGWSQPPGQGQTVCPFVFVQVHATNYPGGTGIYVENLQTAEVTVTFGFSLVNLHSTSVLPTTRTIAGRHTVKLLTLQAIDARRPWRYTYTNQVAFGSRTAVHDDTAVYTLPFASNQTFRVVQGYNGEFSHVGDNLYAIDFGMPEGTAVHAAREGVVAGFKDDSDQGGPDHQYDLCANFILIRHRDGTLGEYVHLKKGGVKVEVGQVVKQGDLIGFSGNTGYTKGPHLHFAVFKARDGRSRETFPVKFVTQEGRATTLRSRRRYSFPP
jgi:murein DD-endopeptidase MepM/ murein hydrolase activator NlpD